MAEVRKLAERSQSAAAEINKLSGSRAARAASISRQRWLRTALQHGAVDGGVPDQPAQLWLLHSGAIGDAYVAAPGSGSSEETVRIGKLPPRPRLM